MREKGKQPANHLFLYRLKQKPGYTEDSHQESRKACLGQSPNNTNPTVICMLKTLLLQRLVNLCSQKHITFYTHFCDLLYRKWKPFKVFRKTEHFVEEISTFLANRLLIPKSRTVYRNVTPACNTN